MESGERRAEGGGRGATGHRETVGTACCISFGHAGIRNTSWLGDRWCRCRCPETRTRMSSSWSAAAMGCVQGLRWDWSSTKRWSEHSSSVTFAAFAGSLMINSPRMGPCSQRVHSGRTAGWQSSSFSVRPLSSMTGLGCGGTGVGHSTILLAPVAVHWRGTSVSGSQLGSH